MFVQSNAMPCGKLSLHKFSITEMAWPELKSGRVPPLMADEFEELVDVNRSHIGVEGVEHIAQGHAHLLGLFPVDVDEQLRRVGPEGRENASQARLMVGLFDNSLGHFL